MKKSNLLIMLFFVGFINSRADEKITLPASKVDFEAFIQLTHEVNVYRKKRLISIDEFNQKAKEKNTLILDTRSTEMYNRKHIKGAVHLDFTDFTQSNLAKIIPSTTTNILIYCNNNFDDDQINFASKIAQPKSKAKKPVSLALNIPTFINLYGYGYRNIYELADLVSVFSDKIEFEGSDVITQ